MKWSGNYKINKEIFFENGSNKVSFFFFDHSPPSFFFRLNCDFLGFYLFHSCSCAAAVVCFCVLFVPFIGFYAASSLPFNHPLYEIFFFFPFAAFIEIQPQKNKRERRQIRKTIWIKKKNNAYHPAELQLNENKTDFLLVL